jgi:Kef-type K+ transport system membrane component KefB
MKRLSELSLEELLKNKARTRAVLIAYVIVVFVLIAVCLYIRFVMLRPITFIPFGILPIMSIPIAVSLKNINAEIKERQAYEKNNSFDK